MLIEQSGSEKKNLHLQGSLIVFDFEVGHAGKPGPGAWAGASLGPWAQALPTMLPTPQCRAVGTTPPSVGLRRGEAEGVGVMLSDARGQDQEHAHGFARTTVEP